MEEVDGYLNPSSVPAVVPVKGFTPLVVTYLAAESTFPRLHERCIDFNVCQTHDCNNAENAGAAGTDIILEADANKLQTLTVARENFSFYRYCFGALAAESNPETVSWPSDRAEVSNS